MSWVGDAGASSDHGAVGPGQSGGLHEFGQVAVSEAGENVAPEIVDVWLRMIVVPRGDVSLVVGVGGTTLVSCLAPVGRVSSFGAGLG